MQLRHSERLLAFVAAAGMVASRQPISAAAAGLNHERSNNRQTATIAVTTPNFSPSQPINTREFDASGVDAEPDAPSYFIEQFENLDGTQVLHTDYVSGMLVSLGMTAATADELPKLVRRIGRGPGSSWQELNIPLAADTDYSYTLLPDAVAVAPIGGNTVTIYRDDGTTLSIEYVRESIAGVSHIGTDLLVQTSLAVYRYDPETGLPVGQILLLDPEREYQQPFALDQMGVFGINGTDPRSAEEIAEMRFAAATGSRPEPLTFNDFAAVGSGRYAGYQNSTFGIGGRQHAFEARPLTDGHEWGGLTQVLVPDDARLIGMTASDGERPIFYALRGMRQADTEYSLWMYMKINEDYVGFQISENMVKPVGVWLPDYFSVAEGSKHAPVSGVSTDDSGNITAALFVPDLKTFLPAISN